MQDISLVVGQHHFNYRVAAVIRHEEKLLVCRAERDEFYYLPGGRVKDGETSAEAVRRELREECSSEAVTEGPLFLVENFFSLHGRRVHELCVYYAATLLEPRAAYPTVAGEDDLLWISEPAVRNLNLKPDFLRERLPNLPKTVEHLVLYDEG